jgi:putative hydroxymethylpyrimidine transport system ATP-binding protein
MLPTPNPANPPPDPSIDVPAAIGVTLTGARLAYDGDVLFDGLDLTLAAGSWTCLLGKSGVGKSSLLRLMAGLTAGATATDLSASDGQPLPPRIAYMAQQDLLLPWLPARDNVLLGSRLRGRKAPRDRADELLAAVGLSGRARALPATLSGGERQRVALARTLMEDRPVVLMDEPFSALDALTRHNLQDVAAGLLRGRTILLVTHDPLEALRLGDRVLVMDGEPARFLPEIAPPRSPPRPTATPEMAALHQRLLAQLGVEQDWPGAA